MSSIVESYTENESDDGSISTNSIEDIWDGSKIYPEINARDSRLKIGHRIRKTQNECKWGEILTKRMVKGLHKLFKCFSKEPNNSLPTLVKSGSEVSHFIP